jgi:hypothetical protein
MKWASAESVDEEGLGVAISEHRWQVISGQVMALAVKPYVVLSRRA